MRLVGPAPSRADDSVSKQYVDDLVAAAPGGGGGVVSLLDAYTGPWTPGGTYQAGNVVSHDGSTYMATAATGTEPAVDAAAWALLAAGLHFTGPWDPAGTYQLGDVVTYAGGTYLSLQLTAAGAAPATDGYWATIAEPGGSGGGGAGGGAAGGYRHAQPVAGSVWAISHQLGYDPAGITVIDTDGDTIDGPVVQYLNPGVSLRLSFELSIAGTAYLS